MKILVSSSNGPPGIGGNTIVMEMLTKYLVKHGNSVKWIYPSLINTPNVYGKSILYSLYSSRHILKIAKDYDILQFNSFVGTYVDYLIGKLARKPSVCLIHELLLDVWKNVSKTKIEKILLPELDKYIGKLPFDFFVCPSDFTKRTLISVGVDKNKVRRIYWGVEHKIFHTGYKPTFKKKYNLKNKFVIGWMGRLDTNDKNLGVLFNAYSMIKEEMKDSVILLAGPNFEFQKENIRKSGLEVGEDIIYCGTFPKKPIWSKEQAEFYSSLDVFATPALIEGFGIPLLEAQACGTPVICFNRTAMPEVVCNKKTGIVLDKISTEAFADAILNYWKKDQKNKFSENCVKWAKQFNWDNVAEEYNDVYSNLLKK
jgi:glycosyltransferase involved in cell wall biosynthesis